MGNEDHTRTFKYWYDPLGNISWTQDDSNTADCFYDLKGQLTSVYSYDNVTGDGVEFEYTYDSAGNILSKELYSFDGEGNTDLLTTDTYTYSDSVWGDLLTAYNGQPITYDANGNPLSYRGMTLTWAKGRRLATLTKNSATTSYAYDRDGLRVQKTVGGVTHTYTYLGDRLVCEEWGSCYLYFIYDETGRPYGLVYCNGTSTETYYFLRNLQGDVLELLESNGAVVAYYEYDPWGKLLSVKDASGNAITSATHIANINPIRYRGYYYDTESGFYYLKSRYYDPEVCRFISPDDPGILTVSPIEKCRITGKSFQTGNALPVLFRRFPIKCSCSAKISSRRT